jgi:hypothetical protein
LGYFPLPVEPNLETRNKIADILKAQNDRQSYLDELEKIVAIDASAGSGRTPRTRYLAAQSALVLAEQKFDMFVAVRLVKPFEVNLRKKRELMKTATEKFSQLVDYEIGEVTAAATFYLAEIYAHFSKALMTSERPEGLSPLEREQYELAIEERAYPFEEKAIAVHENNVKLLSRGVYNEWIEKSLQRLAGFVPARYDKPEESIGIIASLETYIYEIDRPVALAPPEAESLETVQVEESGSVAESEPVEAVQVEEPGSVAESESAETVQVEEPKSVVESEPVEPVQAEEPGSVTKMEPAEPLQTEGPRSVAESESAETVQVEEPKSVTESEPVEPVQVEEPGSVTTVEPAEPVQTAEPELVTEVEPAEPSRVNEPMQAEEPVQTDQLTGSRKHT